MSTLAEEVEALANHAAILSAHDIDAMGPITEAEVDEQAWWEPVDIIDADALGDDARRRWDALDAEAQAEMQALAFVLAKKAERHFLLEFIQTRDDA